MNNTLHSGLQLLKKILGNNLTNSVRPLGHGTKSFLAALYYGFPASKLTIVGITGTKGKTSTTIYSGRLLNKAGYKTGYLSTALTYDGYGPDYKGDPRIHEKTNVYKMSSLDGVVLHRTLRTMVKNGCTHLVIELSSQGLVQKRHWGLGRINIGMFLNIHPEHIESHGSWENYLKAKSILFQNLSKAGTFIANGKDEWAEYMWNAIPNKDKVDKSLIYKGRDFTIETSKDKTAKLLTYNGLKASQEFYAQFECVNAAFALHLLEVVQKQPIEKKQLEYLHDIIGIPGRMEWVLKAGKLISLSETSKIKTSSELNKIDILVDYAHEPESMKQLLETLSAWRKSSLYQHVIHILSCDGVGRDDWKKPVMGDISFANADYTVLTTDNFTVEDNPRQIVDLMAKNFPPDLEGKKYIRETNRHKAFEKALTHALRLQKSDSRVLIVSTGVGSEHGLTQPKGVMKWDEVNVWQKLVLSKNVAPMVTKVAEASKKGTKKSKSRRIKAK